jgi:predicted Abi (CAAX) family protease
VFAVPQLFVSTVKVLFPQADVSHYAAFMLQAFATINQKQRDTVYVNLHPKYMDVVHLHEQELLFSNTFHTEADTDIIYFILSVAEQQKINGDKLKLVLSGDVNANGALLSLLKKYVPDVTLLKRDAGYMYPASFREFQDQQYFTSTAVLVCE